MFSVVSAVQECNVTLLGCVQQRLAGRPIVRQLGSVASLEFLPFGWVVAEPATQIMAGRYVLVPGIHVQRLLSHPARPKAFHKESRAILFRGRIIHSFDLDHCHLHSALTTGRPSEVGLTGVISRPSPRG
jgi:hypothetical protein